MSSASSGSGTPDPGGTSTASSDPAAADGNQVGGVVVIPATQPAGQLARTGSQSGAALLLGGVLVVVGLLVVRYTRPS